MSDSEMKSGLHTLRFPAQLRIIRHRINQRADLITSILTAGGTHKRPEHTDDEIIAEDQPGAEDASPTAQSPDYVPESDPEADPEEE
ncbi:hypothetical protein Tco_1104541 [Tanacetum coccineum]